MAQNKNALKSKINHSDIEDSSRDKERLQPDEATLDLPEVKDIPGQEHIHVPKMKEFADTTASSDDEEGKGLLDDLEEDSDDSNVTKEEKDLLAKSADSMGSEDDENWEKIQLDKTDNDGTPLNEKDDLLGEDLDVPGSNDDDENEGIGEEDEENNSYSLGGDRKD